MVRRCLRAAALAAVLACLLPAGGVAVAQLGDGPPPLTEEPPVPLDGDAEPTPTPAPEPTATATAEPGTPQLPATGAESALVALAGLGMIAAGAGLRVSVGA